MNKISGFVTDINNADSLAHESQRPAGVAAGAVPGVGGAPGPAAHQPGAGQQDQEGPQTQAHVADQEAQQGHRRAHHQG